MSHSTDNRSIGTRLAIIRVTAALSLVYGLLYVFTAFLVLTGGLSQTDEAVRSAAFLIIGTSAGPGVLILLMASFGFRAARNRSRVLPFCVAAVVYTVLMLANIALSGLPSMASVSDILALAYNVLVVVAAGVSISVAVYNKSHPQDGPNASLAR